MPKRERDMTQAQFNAACKRHGFEPWHGGFMGYYQLGDTNTSVSIFNAGTRRRDQLAYLLKEHAKAEKRQQELRQEVSTGI